MFRFKTSAEKVVFSCIHMMLSNRKHPCSILFYIVRSHFGSNVQMEIKSHQLVRKMLDFVFNYNVKGRDTLFHNQCVNVKTKLLIKLTSKPTTGYDTLSDDRTTIL